MQMVTRWILFVVQIQNLRNSIQVQGEPLTDSFDFVIVGGGTAGCVLANRLSENGKHTVLVIHEGDIPDPELDIPVLRSTFWNDPSTVKHFPSVPQKNAGLLENGIFDTWVGKSLGGTSSHNGMAFNRGSPMDFDSWAAITGSDSWNYASMLKYFKKLENYMGSFPSDQHGYGGPITITRPRYEPMVDVWLEAGKSLGYPVADPNGPQKISFCPIETNHRFGRRVSAYTGYIKPILGIRQNLKILTNAEAKRIVFNGDRAVGVMYQLNGKTYEQRLVTAKKEVIISGGVIGSPLLLMKSGIGPKFVLEHANIQLVKDLPVGQNFQEHISTSVDIAINDRSMVFESERDLTPETRRIYDRFGYGPFAFIGGHGQAYVASKYAEKSSYGGAWSDIQLRIANGDSGRGSRNSWQVNVTAQWEALIGGLVMITRPKSRGSITLNVTDVEGLPVIDFQFFSNPDDVAVMVDGIKQTLNIYENTAQFRRLGARIPPNSLPQCAHLKFRSDEYWKCHVMHVSIHGMHGVGTCSMGKGEGDNAVVDPNLRVLGIKGLRVVDASVIPRISNANTMAPVLGLAEKSSDDILRSWTSRKALREPFL